MALDRQSIEKKDFPIGRRGYDPEAVDAHLSAIAAEVGELEGKVSRGGDSVASTAGDRVRAIVEAAEATATQIRQEAEQRADELRTQASSESKAARERASADAGEYVANVAESMSALVDRIDEMGRELGALVDSLRSGAGRIVSDLEQLERDLGAARQAAASPQTVGEPSRPSPPPVPKPQPAAPEPSAPDELEAELALAQDAAPEYDMEPEAEPVAAATARAAASAPPASAPAASAEAPADAEGARLVALNMALNGTPREEVDAYLSDNFDLSDQAALLDEVYASIEG